jgi:hypothetical protein
MNGEQVKPPKCKICDVAHWTWQPHVLAGTVPAESVTKIHDESVAKIAKAVTKKPFSATKTITVTKSHRGRPVLGQMPMTAAERMAKARALKKELAAKGLVK